MMHARAVLPGHAHRVSAAAAGVDARRDSSRDGAFSVIR